MGTQIGVLISSCRVEISKEALTGKKVGFDAYNLLYALLSSIRHTESWGGHLTDSKGNVTSHLQGLFYRLTDLLTYQISPVFVFDGKPPKFKQEEVAIRKEKKKRAEIKHLEAIELGLKEEALKYAPLTTKITPQIVKDTMTLLEGFGIPYILAEEEAEAQGAYMVKRGIINAMASQDYDTFLFGCETVIRNLIVTRRRRITDQSVPPDLPIEEIKLPNLLKDLNLETQDQLILLALLIGTDYNPGVKGIGPKTALKILQKYKTVENTLDHIKLNYDMKEAFPYEPEILIEYFRKPIINPVIDISFKSPDFSKISDFLIKERGFDATRINRRLSAMEKQQKQISRKRNQRALDSFF
ncbi:flap endonuclease-1 [Candidatus Hodarchaeum mangrovi]